MEQANQAGGGSKKALWIIIAIVVILIILYLIRAAFGMAVGKAAGVDIDRHMDGSATYSNSEGTVTVGGNKLPENWPSDAPKYGNANIQYSGSSNPQTGQEGAAIVFSTSDSVQTVVDFYKKELAANGWKIEQTATMGAATVIAAKKDTRTFGMNIADSGNGQVTVTVGITIPKAQE